MNFFFFLTLRDLHENMISMLFRENTFWENFNWVKLVFKISAGLRNETSKNDFGPAEVSSKPVY